MNNIKIVSIIAALTMISVPLFVLGTNDTYGSDTNADVEMVPVDTILQGEHKDDYWVKAILVDNTIVLSNNGGDKKPCILVDPNVSTYDGIKLDGTTFTVPADSGIDLINYELKFNNAQVMIQGKMRLFIGSENVNATIDGGYFLAYEYYADDFSFNVKNNGILEYLGGDFLAVNQLKSDDSVDGFTIGYNSTDNVLLLSGTIIGKCPEAEICPYADVIIDNLVLKDICMNYRDSYNYTITLKNDFINVGTGSYFELVENGIPEIKSFDREVTFASIFYFNGVTSAMDQNPYEDGDISFYACTVDKEGVKDMRTTVQLMIGTAVEKIESGSQYGNYLIVGVNETINLDNIKVVCREGYVFNGWYFVNQYGYEEKIQDTQHFSTDKSVFLVANAVPNSDVPTVPEQKDYTTYFIVIIVIIAIIALVGLLLILRNEGILFKGKD